MSEEKTIAEIGFDLDRSDGVRRVEGRVRFFGDRIELSQDGETSVIPAGDISEYRLTRGVGSVMLEAVQNGEYVLICRATMEYAEVLGICQKRMNAYLRGSAPKKEWLSRSACVCPKCHRPLPPGSSRCPRCAPKKQYLRRLWKMAKPYRGLIYASVLIYFMVAGLNMLAPYVNRILVDDYIKAETLPVFSQYVIVVAMLLLVQLSSRLLTMLRSYLQAVSANKVIVMMRSVTFEKVERMSLSKVSKRTSGELMNRITHDTADIQQFISSETGTAIENILMLAGISVLLFTYDWRLALMVLMPAPLVILSQRLMWNFLRSRYGRQWTLGARSNTVLHDIFSGIRVVKAFGMEKAEHKRYDDVIYAESRTQADNETLFAVIYPVTSFLMGLGEFFLLYFVGNRILDGTMTLGEMQQFSSYVAMIYGPLRWMSGLPRRLSRTMTAVAKVFDVIDEENDVTDKADAVNTDAQGVIDIENVSFGYESSSEVLKNINLSIKPGEMIGIVGRSGVGKSTLINLIMRLYDPDDGVIKLDGVDLRDIKQESLRHNMGVVLQETMLFGGTLYQNIAYAKPDASPEEVINAAKLAGVHKFAVRLPDGYDTVIGEKGYTLSGGERQRVAIARALLHDPRILILDEATSSLDTETEKDIQDALQKLIAGRTTIAIAHRLSTLRNATRLVVLDRGTVAEVGTHSELMKKKGLYYELVMAQRQMSKMAKESA